jgi:glycosyltransferase involved in cell wall biosynthesis
MTKKFAYFLSHPIQYFSPLLKELAKEIPLEVFYFSDASIRGGKDAGFGQNVRWDTPLLDGYQYTFLKNLSPAKTVNNKFTDLFNPGVLRVLMRRDIAVVMVNDWTYSSSLLCIIAGKLLGKKIWLRAENPLNQELRKSKKVVWLKKLVLKQLLFRFFIDRFLYIGSQSRAFFIFYGADPKKLVYTPYAVDNKYFRTQYLSMLNGRDEIRRKLGLPLGKKIILFSGKYIEKKRPLDLLKAYQRINEGGYALVLVGEGALRKEIEQYIHDNAVQDVYLTGFINQSVIPEYYLVADLFVLCSGMGETWGLTANEAMNFSKPVLISTTCGSSYELVEQGVNGFTFEEGNIEELASCMERLLRDDAFCAAAGAASAVRVADFSIEKIVKNISVAFSGAA